jgi:Lrp/AsnC family leucine-responsive transcriptional regulator
MDQIDLTILAGMHRDARSMLTSIAREVGLTPPAVQSRIKRLERDGVVKAFTVLLDHTKLGYEISVLINVTLSGYKPETVRAFQKAVLGEEAIVECHVLTGGADFVLRAMARDVAGLNQLLTETIGQLPHVASFETHLVLRTVKFDYSVLLKGQHDK